MECKNLRVKRFVSLTFLLKLLKVDLQRKFLSNLSLALKEYLYKGTLPLKEEILKELIVYSEKILLKGLKVHCERIFVSQIKKENAVELYELSKMSGAEDLREACLQVIASNLSHFVDELASVLRTRCSKKNS